MRFTAKRLIGAGVFAIAAIAAPISIAALTSGPTAVASNAPAPICSPDPTFDQVCFAQTTNGNTSADAYQYVPTPANGSPSATQPVTISGNCAAPTAGGAPIIAMCGQVYASSTYATGPVGTCPTNSSLASPCPAPLGSNNAFTGVGAVSPAYSIENKSGQGAEAIDFSPGTDTAVTGSSRLFTRAQIPITRKDSGVSQNPFITVGLMEFDSSGAQVGLQYCTLTGKVGAQITADTMPGGCSFNGTVPSGAPAPSPAPAFFQTVEVQNYTISSSISVGGASPATAIFTLGKVVCGGSAAGVPHSASSTGPVTATLTMTGGANQCKTYSSFSSTNSTLSFNGVSSQAVQFVANITWPTVALCSPYVDPPPGNPDPRLQEGTGITDAPGVVGGSPGVIGGAASDMCPVHQFSFDNVNYYDQGYCQKALAPPPAGTAVEPQQELCTVSKAYNNDLLNADGTVQIGADGNPVALPGPGGQPGTQIVENWDGNIDNYWR
jgi:hypothetical protein